MTVMLVGGGSGGHITPLLAIARHLKSKNSDIQITVISERGGKFAAIFDDSTDIDTLKFISAGKLRRFHGESWIARIRDVKRSVLNIRDVFRLAAGFSQSLWLLIRHRPQIILIKGGYVGVPVGVCAWLLRIPYITHDSDALAGLTNRLIGRGAQLHAVGMPVGSYAYPKNTMIFTGIPVGEDFYPVSQDQVRQAKENRGIPPDSRVLLITGGSNGALRLDAGIHEPVRELLERFSDLWVIHQFGADNDGLYDDFSDTIRGRVIARAFLSPLSDYSAAADLIVARAGATAMAEFAAQEKACVIVPNPFLTGGHQLKNAISLAKSGAAMVLEEQDLLDDKLGTAKLIGELLESPERRAKMAHSLHQAMPSDAAARLADLLIHHISGPGVRRK